MVSPTGNFSGASLITLATPTLSVATGVSKDTVLSDLDVASSVMSDGAVMDGMVVSTMVTFWVAVAELPDSSVAVHVTVVSPSGNFSGASLVTFTWLTESFAIGAVNDTVLSAADVASDVMFSGAVNVGDVVSTMVTF